MKDPRQSSPLIISRRQALKQGGALALGSLVGRPASLRASSAGASGFRAAAQYSAAHTGVSFLVSKEERIIFEDYPNGGSEYTAHKIYSGTKGFWILAGLKAIEEGILNLDEHVAATIPEWAADPQKSRVTLRQLLNFSSGLYPEFSLHGDGFENRDAIAMRAPLVAPPGSAFIYGPAALQVFHEVLKRKLAGSGETPTKYLERKVLKPLGLGSQRYLADRDGNPLLATGFILSARQWLRLGHLILNGGHPVVSPQLLPTCFRGSPANCAFGMGFWNNVMAPAPSARELDVEQMLEPKWNRQDWRDACLCRAAPSDMVASVGSGYQRLFVIPSLKMVIVRQGNFGRISDGELLRLALERA